MITTFKHVVAIIDGIEEYISLGCLLFCLCNKIFQHIEVMSLSCPCLLQLSHPSPRRHAPVLPADLMMIV